MKLCVYVLAPESSYHDCCRCRLYLAVPLQARCLTISVSGTCYDLRLADHSGPRRLMRKSDQRNISPVVFGNLRGGNTKLSSCPMYAHLED